jgi:hypothetical protein
MKTIDGGIVVGFVVAFYGSAFAIVRYGRWLRMVAIEDIELVENEP